MSPNRIAIHLIVAFLGMGWFNFSQAQTATQPRISLPTYLMASGRPGSGGGMEGVGLRINNHELALQLPSPFYLDFGYSFGAHYRYYLPGAGIPASPFFQLDAGYGRGYQTYSVSWDGEGTGSRSKGVSFGLGLDYRIRKGFGAYILMGGGMTQIRTDVPVSFISDKPYFSPQLSAGLKYDILLQGERDDEITLPENYQERPRLFFSYRLKSMLSRWYGDPYGKFLSTTHQITAELGLLRWMRAYGGFQFGTLSDQVDTTPFALQGVGAGIKAHLYQWKRLALFQDVGYWIVRRPKFDLYGSRVQLGSSLEYRLQPGMYLYAGHTLGFLSRTPNSPLHETHLGFSISPGEMMGKK